MWYKTPPLWSDRVNSFCPDSYLSFIVTKTKAQLVQIKYQFYPFYIPNPVTNESHANIETESGLLHVLDAMAALTEMAIKVQRG